MNEVIKIPAGALTVGIERTNEGVCLYSLRDKESKKNILTHPSPLFTLTAENLETASKTVVSSHEGWKHTSVCKTATGCVITCSDNGLLPKVTVTLSAVCYDNTVEWHTALVSANKEYTLVSCDYPVLSFNTGDDVMMFYPYGCGEVYDTPLKRGLQNGQDYPSYGISMQYMAMYNRVTGTGIYYGTHDPAPAAKRFSFLKNAGERYMKMYASQPLSMIDRGENSQCLHGKCVWTLFKGDWYDAAVIYRTWVETQADYFKNDLLKLPDWFVKAPHWWLVHIGDDDSFADDIIKSAEDLGTDSPVHLYLWHNAPFDNDYPHYFPVKEHAKKGVEKLHAKGIKVMPYINGRLWDTRDRQAEDWMFTKEGKPNCTKDRHGIPITETYSSKEVDGSKVCLSVMCPSTPLWQDKMAYTVDRLINEEGFDAVYMDQIAAAKPQLCCDKNHPHVTGGGDWWCRSYRQLLDKVYLGLPEGTALTTECTGDPFVSHMGGYLSWLWIRNEQVPAFSVIYSKYITMFGRSYQSDSDENFAGLRIFIAQSLCYGEQLGWISPKRFDENPFKQFYVNCVHTRVALEKFFIVGSETMRPPVIKSDLPRLRTEKCSQAIYGIVEEDAVMGCIRKSSDGETLLLLVNAGETGGNVTVSASVADGKYGEFEFKDGKAEIYIDALSIKYTKI